MKSIVPIFKIIDNSITSTKKKFCYWFAWGIILGVIFWQVSITIIGKRSLRPIARAQLQQLIGANVMIESVDFKGGLVVMRGMKIKDTRKPYGQTDILNVNKVEFRFSLLSILRFQPRIKRISISRPVVNAIFDTESGQWNVGWLNVKKDSNAAVIPDVEIIDGTLNISTATGPVFKNVTTCGMSGILLRLRNRVGAYVYDLRADKRFDFAGSKLRGIWKKGQKGRFTMEGNVSMSKSPVFGNAWGMRNIDLEMEYDETDLQMKHLRWDMGDTRVELIGALNDYKNKPNYSLDLQIDDILLSPDQRDNALVYSQEVVSILGKGSRRFLDRYTPRGTGDMNIGISGTFGQIDKTTVEGTITCKDISIIDNRFPYPMDHVTGTLDINNKRITLNDLRAKHKKVDISLNGFTDIVDGELVYDVRVTSDNMRLDSDLYRALSIPKKKLWFIFTPTGFAKINLKLIKKTGQKPDSSLELQLVDVESVYQHFPYPLKNLTGTVLIKPDMFGLKNVTSRYDGKTITLNGYVADTQSERPQFHIDILAQNIPIDDTLKQALPTAQREFYDYFDVDAMTDVEIKVFPNEVDRRLVEYIAYIKIMGTSLVYEKFPLHLTDLYVDAILTADQINLKEVKGKSGTDGEFSIDGWVWPANDYYTKAGYYCLNIEAKEVELDDVWLTLLPNEASDAFVRCQSSGKANITASLDFDAKTGYCSDYTVLIECPYGKLEAGRESWNLVKNIN